MTEQLFQAGQKSVAGPMTSNGKISSHTSAPFKSDTSDTDAVRNLPSSPSSNNSISISSALRNPGLMAFLVLEGHKLHLVGLYTGAVLRERRGSRQEAVLLVVGVAAAVAEAGSEAGVGVVRGVGVQAPVAVSVWMLRLRKT